MDGWNLFVLGLFVLLIVAFAWFGVRTLVKYFRARKTVRASMGWPAVQGRVLEAYVGHHSDDEDTVYYPVVRYAYTVAGQEYTSDQIAFGPEVASSMDALQAEKTVARYPEGSLVTVYYNPDNPQEAVLERRLASPVAALVIGAGFLGVALYLALKKLPEFLALAFR